MRFFKRLRRFPFLAIMIAVFLTVTAAVIFMDRDKRLTDRKAVPDGREVRPQNKDSIPEAPARSPKRTERRNRQIAVIIDDIGFDLRAVEELAQMRVPIAFAVLPSSPHAAEAARLLHRAGKEILLHLPMEPRSYPVENPGEGALFTNMDAGEIRRQIETHLTVVAYASGVNNHMGSLFMENEAALSVVMEELAKRDLFFVDSRTTPNSLGRQAATRAGVRFAERAVFIDHHRGYSAALTNLTQPRRPDGAKGKPLLLIGHPHDETILAIREAQAIWREEEMQVISISAFITRIAGEEKKNALVKYR
jgi:polysaccharide deacetylase 2 family uncharacterized protein YibQ